MNLPGLKAENCRTPESCTAETSVVGRSAVQQAWRNGRRAEA